MSKFLPPVGALFYADSQVHLLKSGDGFTATVTKSKDCSYQECIFRCVGHDSRAVIGEFVYGSSYKSKQRMFLQEEYAFHPVGPAVAKALNISEE